MKVQLRPITSIRPYDRNPRLNDQAVDAVAASIREFGFRQPIVVDEEGVIIVGHTRYKAALKLGLDKVPVHVATGLTPAQIKAYRLADNQTASLAQWDYDLLPLELAELQKMNVDLDVTGFSAEEILRLLEPSTPVGLTDPDDIPEPPGRTNHPTGRPVAPGKSPSVVRRLSQASGCGSLAGRRPGALGQYGPAVQRESRAALQ